LLGKEQSITSENWRPSRLRTKNLKHIPYTTVKPTLGVISEVESVDIGEVYGLPGLIHGA
jgi:GTPase involved in cell partitioning and DNA repair